MLERLPVKQNYLFVAGAVSLLLICYKLALNKTVETWQTNVQLKSQLNQSADLSYQPGYLDRKNINLDKVIDLYKTDTIQFRNISINKIAIIAEKEDVKLSEVPLQTSVFYSDRLITQKINLEGDYYGLIKTLNTLHTTAGIGVIRSVVYRIARGRTNVESDKKLVAEIYLEIAK
jgi:hypothetical protein